MTDPTKLSERRQVEYFQGHHNYLGPHHHIPWHPFRLVVDGDPGPLTRAAIKEEKLSFGVKPPVSAALTDEFLRMQRDPFSPGNALFTPARDVRGLAYRTKLRRQHSAKLKAAAAGSYGEKALKFSKAYVGKTEVGNNAGPWLNPLDHTPVLPTDELNWMIPGNPYCGLGVIVSFWKGAKIWLPAGFVYTPNILNATGRVYRPKYGHPYKLIRIPLSQVRAGSILVYDWSPGSGADHTAISRGKLSGGMIPSREWNTSPTNAGSQGNGGGVWDRSRAQRLILGAVNVERV